MQESSVKQTPMLSECSTLWSCCQHQTTDVVLTQFRWSMQHIANLFISGIKLPLSSGEVVIHLTQGWHVVTGVGQHQQLLLYHLEL